MYYLITILLLFLAVVMAVKSLSRRHQHDSALKRKYQNMAADFVVLDQNYQVVVVVVLGESGLRRAHQQYERRLLQLAGYRVLHYSEVPDYHDLRRDLLTPETEMAILHATPQLERMSNAFVKS